MPQVEDAETESPLAQINQSRSMLLNQKATEFAGAMADWQSQCCAYQVLACLMKRSHS